jgi:hypothetical protein
MGCMVQSDVGPGFEIIVDGKSRSHRDRKETAIEAGRYLKQMQPQSVITVRDVRDNSVTVIEAEKNVASVVGSKASKK